MKVYVSDEAGPRLIGRADVDDEGLPTFEVRLFGAASMISDIFTIGTVTNGGNGTGVQTERVILLSATQRPEILPGWHPLAS